MDLIWLVPLILGSLFAISGGHGSAGKFLNFIIILACMGIGFGIGYAAGLSQGNFGRIPGAALPLSMMFGIVAALGCIRINNWRLR
jgi:hypothetical protein